MYTLYCNVLNNRLQSWADAAGVLNDLQNVFRKTRSTTDHIHSVCSLIENIKGNKKSTFAAFIDFKKAYDCIDRGVLWEKVSDIGVKGKCF